METPEIERRAIEDYLKSQSGSEFVVEHVEKLTSEYVHGHQYDVWDAHTNEGRWWVITPYTYLYSQDQIKSMDIALSFHIGLMSRMLSRNPIRHEQESSRIWVLEVFRRLETASDALDRAKEVEDFQAVGMRLREALLTLTEKLRDLNLEVPQGIELPEYDGNFKQWAEVFTRVLAPGSSLTRQRKILKAQSAQAWEYLGWLTHARNAGKLDGRLGYSLTSAVIEAFLLIIERFERHVNERCPACSSYQFERHYIGDGDWIQLCVTCGWQVEAEPPVMVSVAREDSEGEAVESAESKKLSAESECVILEDFEIYITPAQARRVLEEASEKTSEEDYQPAWVNPFAVQIPDDGSMHDVHRLVFTAHRHEPKAGTELVYSCHEDSCVNPQHADESALPDGTDWHPILVESVIAGPVHLELNVASSTKGRSTFLIETGQLDQFGIGDASSLLERVFFVSGADSAGWRKLAIGARRVDYSVSSILTGWERPPTQIDVDAPCPCGSSATYAECHG